MDVALYLIPRQGFREQVSSIVDTSHFLEVQVTFACFLLDPQIIGVQMPQFAQSSWSHNGEGCARISQYHSIHVRAEVFVHRNESHCFGRHSHEAVQFGFRSTESHNSLCFAPHFDETRSCNCVSSCCAAACSSATCPICL